MVYMSENVEAGCDSAKWWPRCMGCEPCCFATFEAKGDGAYVGLTPNRPAKVLPLVLGGRRFLGKKGMYFASTGHVDVDFNMDLNPVTCCCGGQGMIRQVLKGDGIAFIGAMGVLTHKVLAPGEKLIDTCVETKIYGAFSPTSTPSARRLPAWRGDACSTLDRARTAASSPRNDLVKSCRVHPTHLLISTRWTRTASSPGRRPWSTASRRTRAAVHVLLRRGLLLDAAHWGPGGLRPEPAASSSSTRPGAWARTHDAPGRRRVRRRGARGGDDRS